MTQRYPYLLLTSATLIWLLIWSSARSIAQSTPVSKPVPQITFNDQGCADIVRAYLSWSKVKAIRIRINPTSTGYQCNLLAAHYYENIANYAPTVWGHWQNCLVVFQGDSVGLSRAIRVNRPTSSISLLAYLQDILPDDRPPLPKLPKGVTMVRADRGYDDFGWTFRIERGREVWFSKDGGYNSEADVPDSLPTAPEAKNEP